MALDRATAEAALVAWAALVTGADPAVCVWEDAVRPRHNGVLVLLSEVSNAEVGADAAGWVFAPDADPLAEMTPTVQGSRLWVVQVSVEVHDQRAATSARAVAQRAAARALWPRARAILAAAGCAVAKVGDPRPAGYTVDGRRVSREIFELRLNATVSEADVAGRTSYIASVSATAVVTDAVGNALPDALQPTGVTGP